MNQTNSQESLSIPKFNNRKELRSFMRKIGKSGRKQVEYEYQLGVKAYHDQQMALFALELGE